MLCGAWPCPLGWGSCKLQRTWGDLQSWWGLWRRGREGARVVVGSTATKEFSRDEER